MPRRTELIIVAAAAIVAVAAIAAAIYSDAASRARSAQARPAPTFAPDPTPAPTPAATPVPLPPTPVPAPAEGVLFIISQEGSVRVQTAPGSTCALSATDRLGRPFSTPGMGAARAPQGIAQWQYDHSDASGLGGTHTVTCSLGGLSATVSASFLSGS